MKDKKKKVDSKSTDLTGHSGGLPDFLPPIQHHQKVCKDFLLLSPNLPLTPGPDLAGICSAIPPLLRPGTSFEKKRKFQGLI